MSKNDKERLVDTIMGEAVLHLLENDDNVSFDALIGQLQENLQNETDRERRDAFRTAINGVHQFRSLQTKSITTPGSLKQSLRSTLAQKNTSSTKH
ncbi:hypothetical protein [Enterobacter sp.]|uniref:hypothetical protein n=1 Tax=Enterobacter sp. TaxID=42895 RepID=UPI00296FFEFB|nr:hypothetical protein [Enterobacter sp.]